MADLVLNSIQTDGSELSFSPGKHGIRCHVPISVFTDDTEIPIEANVDSEFETASGKVHVYRRHTPVSFETWPIEAPAPQLNASVDGSVEPSAAAAAQPAPAAPSK